MHDEAPELDVAAIIRVLARHSVEAVIIGGVAAVLQGAHFLTRDLDMVPRDELKNLARLSGALAELNAEVRWVGKVPELADGEWLRSARTWNLRTKFGDFDILFVPAGAPPFEELLEGATRGSLDDGTEVKFASLDDLIAMKEAAGRTKDLLALPILRYLKERQENPPPSE